MTQAEKMAKKHRDKFRHIRYMGWENPTIQEEAVNLIHQVAERTREECFNAFIHKKTLQYALTKNKVIAVVIQGDGINAIRDARWEDEEV